MTKFHVRLEAGDASIVSDPSELLAKVLVAHLFREPPF